MYIYILYSYSLLFVDVYGLNLWFWWLMASINIFLFKFIQHEPTDGFKSVYVLIPNCKYVFDEWDLAAYLDSLVRINPRKQELQDTLGFHQRKMELFPTFPALYSFAPEWVWHSLTMFKAYFCTKKRLCPPGSAAPVRNGPKIPRWSFRSNVRFTLW